MMEVVFVLSALGFAGSLLVHLVALLGLADVPLGLAWAAFFPSMALAVVLNTRVILQRYYDYTDLPPGEFWRFITRNAPDWMRSLQFVLVLYAVLNFYVTMLVVNRGGYPRLVDGAYVLERHKVVIETLTRQEYLWHASFVVRMLSSIAMAVFFAAVMRWIARWRTVASSQPRAAEETAGQPDAPPAR